MEAFAALEPEGREALAKDLDTLIEDSNTSGDATMIVPSAYAEVVAGLRTVRGGTVLTDEEAIELLEHASLVGVHSVPGEWPLPVRFVAGRRSP